MPLPHRWALIGLTDAEKRGRPPDLSQQPPHGEAIGCTWPTVGEGASIVYSYPGLRGDGEALAGLGAWFGCAALFALVLFVLYLWLFYRIFVKAGFSGWLTLLNLIPSIGTVIVLFILAFGEWPTQRGVGPPQSHTPVPPPQQPVYPPPPGPAGSEPPTSPS